MHSVRVSSQLLVSGLFIAVPTNTENFYFFLIAIVSWAASVAILLDVYYYIRWIRVDTLKWRRMTCSSTDEFTGVYAFYVYNLFTQMFLFCFIHFKNL